MRWSILSCFAMVILATAPAARADADLARRHFEVGKKLRDDGDCQRAIPAFEKSLEAEKSIGAYYNLGFCHERLGRRQAAYEAYRSAQQLASAKKDDRLRDISGAIAALLETPHIRIALPQPLPPDLTVTVDGTSVPESLYGAEMVVFTEPGKEHVVVVTAPGYEERRETVEAKQLKVIELRPIGQEAPPVASAPPERSWTWQHWTGLGLAAGGIAVGAFSLARFLGHLSALDDIRAAHAAACSDVPNDAQCKADAVRKHNDDTTAENERARPVIITTSVIAGVLFLSGGALFLTALAKDQGAEKKTGIRVVPYGTLSQPLGLGVVGRF